MRLGMKYCSFVFGIRSLLLNRIMSNATKLNVKEVDNSGHVFSVIQRKYDTSPEREHIQLPPFFLNLISTDEAKCNVGAKLF